jgi:hypothetical protein
MSIDANFYVHAALYSHDEPVGNLHKKNSVALARKQTISTERPPLVGEIIANFCRQGNRHNEFVVTFVFCHNYWVFRVCPSSRILKAKERNVSEIGSVS